MKELKIWLIYTGIFYLFFLISLVPAERALLLLHKRQIISPAALSLINPSGTWLAGKVQHVRVTNIDINNLAWRLQPSALILGRIQFAINGDIMSEKLSCKLGLSLNEFMIKDLNASLPADRAIRAYLPGLNLDGSLEVENLSFAVAKRSLQNATGLVSWKEAALGSPYNTPLGGLSILLTTEDNGIEFKVNDLDGPLQADGLGFISFSGDYSYNGWVAARQGSSPELSSFLQILGSPQADGKVKIKYKGRLPRLF